MGLLLSLAAIFEAITSSGSFAYPVTDNADFLVVPIPRQRYIFELRCDPDNPKTVREWRVESGGEMAFNAGFFDDDMRPVGYAKTGGGEWGDPRNHPAVLGFSVASGFRLEQAEVFHPDDFRYAASGFPLLLWNGTNLFSEETGKFDRRTIIGFKNDIPYLFVSSRGHPSLAESAAALERFGIEKALNLDGGTSTGFSSDYTDIYSIVVPCVFIGFHHLL